MIIKILLLAVFFSKFSFVENALQFRPFDLDNYELVTEYEAANISAKCEKDLRLWSSSLRTAAWAREMLDASGKIPAGILKGNLYSLGQYDECVSIAFTNDTTAIRGKYCSALVSLPNKKELRMANLNTKSRPGFRFGVCLPDSCHQPDFEYVLHTIQNLTGGFMNVSVSIPESLCSTADPKPWDTFDWLALSFFIIFALLVILSSAYDAYLRFYKKAPIHGDRISLSFSLISNTERLFKLNRSSLKCIHGIRTITMMWIILCHRYLMNVALPTLSALDILDFNNHYSSMIIIGGTVSVDTFFFLSGLLLAYVFFKQIAPRNHFSIFTFYLHRFLRLTPALGGVVLFCATLFRHIGDGPMWNDTVDAVVGVCRKRWWTTLLYVSNYVHKGEVCVPQTWYLSVDTQLYVLSPVLLYPLWKNLKVGLVNLGVWLLIAFVTLVAFVLANHWSASLISFGGDQLDQVNNYYMATHTRALPWLIGFAFGYFMYYTENMEIRINKIVSSLLWLLSLAIMSTVILVMKPLQRLDRPFDRWLDSSYNCFARGAWALAVAWVVFACSRRYGGPVNWFLSLGVWEILGRLSYSMYLVHMPWQIYTASIRRYEAKFTNLFVLYEFCGDLVFVIIIAYFLTMMLESPLIIIEKIMLRPSRAVQQKTESIENLA